MQSQLSRMRKVLGPYEALVEAFDNLGLPRRTIGRTLFGVEIYAYKVGDSGPVGMVTAGAHAEEVAGVAASFSLASESPQGLQGWVVPCRDPLGWDGFRRTLSRAVGQNVTVQDHSDVISVLERFGELLRSGDVTVGLVGEVAFLSLAEEHPGWDDTGVFAHEFFEEEEELREQLLGRRIFLPGAPKLTSERDVYDWGGGPTIYIHTDGRVGNFNRFFSVAEPPIEVEALRNLTDEVVPKWTLDLHEGFGSSYCLYANIGDHPVGREAAQAMVEAVASREFPLMTLSELAAYVGFEESAFAEIVLGVYQGSGKRPGAADAYCPYAGSLGSLCFTTEMGMESPLDVRLEMMEVSARACLEVLKKLPA